LIKIINARLVGDQAKIILWSYTTGTTTIGGKSVSKM
jgi:hypothetical protein